MERPAGSRGARPPRSGLVTILRRTRRQQPCSCRSRRQTCPQSRWEARCYSLFRGRTTRSSSRRSSCCHRRCCLRPSWHLLPDPALDKVSAQSLATPSSRMKLPIVPLTEPRSPVTRAEVRCQLGGRRELAMRGGIPRDRIETGRRAFIGDLSMEGGDIAIGESLVAAGEHLGVMQVLAADRRFGRIVQPPAETHVVGVLLDDLRVVLRVRREGPAARHRINRTSHSAGRRHRNRAGVIAGFRACVLAGSAVEGSGELLEEVPTRAPMYRPY